MRTSSARSRSRLTSPRLRALGALGTGLVLAGCATMPSTGAPPAQPVSGDNTQAAQQVVVVAEAPNANDQPAALFSSFLDDLVSDEQDYHTAKEFLTPAAAKAWNPQQQVAVLDKVNASLVGDPTATRATIRVSGTEVAVLDARHAFKPPQQETYTQEFTLLKGAQGWRIDTPPEGIILNEVDFARIYESVDLYFPVAAPDGGDSTAAPSALVADPIYVRSHIDPLTDAANALLGGPSAWLAPAVATGFPQGSSLGKSVVTIGGETGGNGVSLTFGGAVGARLQNPPDCDQMAAQLYFTLSEIPTLQAQQGGEKIESVSLYRKGDATASCRADGTSHYSPFAVGSGTTSYFVGANGRLESLDVGSGNTSPVPKPVPVALAPASAGHIGGFAVAPGISDKVAVLSANQRDLYIGSLSPQSTAPMHPTLSSTVVGGLSSPSWDGLGRLWVADTAPAAPALRAVVGGKVVTVPVADLHGTVTGVRVAADGVRIALTVKNGDTTSVQVGRIEQSGTAAAPVLTVSGLKSVTQSLTGVKSVSWFDGDSLIVLGQSAGTAPGLTTWQVDGSSVLAADDQLPSPADGMTTVAALAQYSSLENGLKAPLLGDSNGASGIGDTADKGKGKVYRWSKNQWQEVAQGDTTVNGPMPSYPG
ncbi:LpqB family beta-propeller domain-containing protein [Streptacidiphilus cavernicola]|uniref:LpqB family beta-propeller domain-containing protein n=1 Tax=Streptacidiphilus cavernicola TaxID=3342716 RepID=A0ABV6VZR5_9ACTN